MDPAQLLDLISRGGALGSAAIVIWLLITEKIVPKSRLTEQRDERLSGVQASRSSMEGALRRLDGIEEKLDRLIDTVDRIRSR